MHDSLIGANNQVETATVFSPIGDIVCVILQVVPSIAQKRPHVSLLVGQTIKWRQRRTLLSIATFLLRDLRGLFPHNGSVSNPDEI